jgi:hypothetical protein
VFAICADCDHPELTVNRKCSCGCHIIEKESKLGKPILSLDFDGVCHSYSSGWKGADVIPDPAVDGLFEFLESVKEHFDVQVFSSRSHQIGGKEAMVVWFFEQRNLWRERGNKPPLETPLSISFPDVKPQATVGLDDRVLLFTGKWPSLEQLKQFKPWNKGGRCGDLADGLQRNFTDKEQFVLAELAYKLDISNLQVMRQALRLYQLFVMTGKVKVDSEALGCGVVE